LPLWKAVLLFVVGVFAPNVVGFMLFPFISILIIFSMLGYPLYIIYWSLCKFYEKKDMDKTEVETK
jgi:hypothetical protein